MKLYDFTVKDMEGQITDLREYENKVLLIVNTATGCGFTPQYEGLEKLYENYRQYGFEVLGFPCNQFAHQTPGTEKEIQNFCQLRYHVSFPQFAKIEVNGPRELPLYTFLKSEKNGIMGQSIKWNFTKFLIDQSGNVIKRYAPTTKPETIDRDIAGLLKLA